MKSHFPVSRLHFPLTLVLLYGLGGEAWAASCTASYTHTSNGGSSNYTLGSGQSLKIASGTYTGTIEFGSGASICVETGATFTPAGLNNVAGTLINYGTANLQTFAYNAGTVIDNHGTLSFTGGLNTNGATTFRNRTNARMSMANSFQLGNNSTFINDGLLVAQQDFNTQNGTTLLNNHRLEMEGNFNPDGKFDNYGRVYAKAFMNINANSDVSNHCTLVSWGGFNNNSPLMDNQGTILITTATGAPGGLWQNNKPFKNGSNAKIAGGDFTNNDSFTGGGQMIFSGFTRNNGAFTGNSSSDKITFYDETQTGSQLFDVEGITSTNTVRAAFPRPTELDAPSNCSTSYKNFANPAGTVSGTVYTDSNLNNTLDATETKLPNITVWLYDSTGITLLQTKTTDASGAYAFTGVTTGTYQVKTDAADTDRPTGATIGTTNPLIGITVTAGATTANQNFGFDSLYPTAICSKNIDNPLELDFSGTATLVSGTPKQVGSVYRFSNVSSGVDALVTLNALQADSLPRWLEGDLGGQLQGAQTNKYFDMTVNLVKTGTSTAISPVDLVLTSFDLDGSVGEPYSDGVEYFSPAATFTGAGSQLQASDMGGSVRYTLPLSARGVDDATAVDPAYAAGAIYTDVSSFRTKGLVVDDDGSSTRSIFIYANGDSFKQFGALTCDSSITVSTVNGTIFEDVNYGGGVGRAFGTAGTVGISGVRVELYDATGKFLSSTTTTAGGNYSFTTLPTGNYYVRVVNDSVSSSRLGTNGSELAIQTYRSNDSSAVNNEVGGRNPASPDAPANTGAQALNTTNFTLSASSVQAQSVQPVSVGSGNVNGVSFGFNFNTVVNTNDAGQGSLRQVLLNAGILSDDAALEQANGYVKGTENAIFMLSITDPQYVAGTWTVKLNSALPNITAPLALDGRKQAGFSNQPVIVLDGSSAGASNGITLDTGSNGSIIQALAIKNFNDAGIRLNQTANNQIGGTLTGQGNIITANGEAGIAVTAATAVNNSILGNSIHGNGGLGIDLNNNGVTANDAGDTDTGANHLLNYPAVIAASFGSNGSKIVTYDFSLDVPANTHGYRLEFFKNATKDASGHGEGQFYLGSKDFMHTGGALKFKGSFNANQTVATSEFISVTVTEKTSPTAFGSTSEFSGAINGNTAIVCTSLLDNPNAALPDMVIDENALTITYLQAKDSSGNPVTYVISGGADAAMFSVGPVTNGTIDCAQIHFIKTMIVKNTLADTRAIVPSFVDPGNFEIPMDKDKDNVYDLEITATDVNGKKHVRTLSLKVMDVNEAPAITSSTAFSIEEDGNTKVADIQAQDPDKGDTLRYDISGGTDKAVFTVNSSTGALSFKAAPDYDAPTDSNRDNAYEVTVTVTDSGGLTASKTFTVKVLNRVTDDGVKLQVRAFLQGAYDNKAGLMSTDLNLLNLLPTNQPYQAAPFNYAGTETLSTLVKENTDHHAAVDWVLVELRLSPTTIASSRAVMLQRDGNLVDAQTGSSTLHFANVKAGNYYVSVRHRNHLGVMSASPLSLGNTEQSVDFTLSSTAVKGTETRYMDGALALLWVGDINGSNTLTGSGPGNDITGLLSSVITNPENPQAQTNYILRGYFNTDLNMDGKTLFSGPDNDVSILIGNVVLHPLNDNFAANYIVRGGL